MKYFILILLIFSCNQKRFSEKIENHIVIKVWKESIPAINGLISPNYKAVLENGDTISVKSIIVPNDTIKYKILNK